MNLLSILLSPIVAYFERHKGMYYYEWQVGPVVIFWKHEGSKRISRRRDGVSFGKLSVWRDDLWSPRYSLVSKWYRLCRHVSSVIKFERERIHVRNWRSGRPTLFVNLFRYTIAVGGFAGNTFPGIHIELGNRLVSITIRTGGRKRNGYWSILRETRFYVRLGQEVYKKYPEGKHNAWRVDWYSHHFILLCQFLHKLNVPFVEYSETEPHDSGHYFASGKILFVSNTDMF